MWRKLIGILYKSESTMTLIGLILITLLVSFYYYHNPKTIDIKNVVSVDGVLKKKPKYIDNGENPSYISIYIMGDKKMFKLSGCGLIKANKDLLYQKNIGDKIKLYINQNDYHEKYGILNKTIKITGIEIENSKILAVSMINNCEKRSWSKLIWLAQIMGIILIVKIGLEIRKLIQNK